MDKRRAKTLCTCLFAVGSARAYILGPSVLHAAPEGAPGPRSHLPSSSSSFLATCRERCPVRSRNDDQGGAGVRGGRRRSKFSRRSRPEMQLRQTAQENWQEKKEQAAEAEAEAEAAAQAASNAILVTSNRTKRGQRLRAVNWVKQVRNELTSAEFALNLNGAMWTGSGTAEATFSSTPTSGGIINGEATSTSGPSASSASSSSSSVVTTPAAGSKTEIDYDSIAERLEASLRALQAGRPLSLREAVTEDELRDITTRLKVNVTKVKKITQAEGRGGVDSAPPVKNASGKDGKGTASGKGRKGMTSGKDGKGTTAEEGGGEEQGGSWKDAGGILGDVKEGINVNLKDVKVPEFDLFVRDDGTVDWDGAIQSGREVARFGQELWDRINGQNPDEEGGGGHVGGEKPAKEIPEDSAVMLKLRAIGAGLEHRQEQLERELDAVKADARAQEATWNAVERRNANRRIRSKEARLKNAKRQLQLHKIDADMERICYNIEQEIRESTATSLSEYRLLVAEFGLLDAQLANLTKLMAESSGEEANDGLDNFVIDEDELELVSREVLDLKNRLGLDLVNPALSVDPEKVSRRYLKETYDKIKSGVDFYWTGTKILGNDVGYAFTLVSKAVQGSILLPREVRTLRRTAKDCVTFIPFVIILIFPLTPIGHVLVFSFIQRFFPNFFPSTYTDRRQNLLKMYTEVDKKVDWEDSDRDDGGDDILENLRRNFISTLNPNQGGDQSKKDR
ncbi:unnamed protein product [Pylaiella littoralis]